jgi:ubiquinone/menaquinone biosynthesis C-methylase UbiE
MKMELNLVTGLHQATKRDYLGRMNDSKVEAMKKAKQYGYDYWDGDRRFGYGGYKYMQGRWAKVAQQLIDLYGLRAGSKILDVGCGKGFLLYEIQLLQPGIEIHGFDISQYGLENTHPDLKAKLFIHRAQEKFPFQDNFFDLVISLGTLHNLHIFELEVAVSEIERVGKQGYIMVESFRNELEMFNLECWALTAESLMDVDEWKWIYDRFGFTGDYEFIFFE